MEQQGIYVTPCNNEPNRDRADVAEAACKEQRLWIIEFVVNSVGKGCAVAKANSPKQAETLLKTEGIFNGTPNKYSITRIEEIIPSPASMLICEQLSTDVNDLD